MAPHGEAIKTIPPRLSTDSLRRTTSDILFELRKEAIETTDTKQLPTISEVENAKCECCGMIEEFTPEYVEREREKYLGKWICGLCAEAVKGEMEKNGNNKKEALETHMSVCVRFNKFDRAYPVLYQAEAMRALLKRSSRRAQSISPRDKNNCSKNGVKSKGIARSSSCIPAITRDMN